MEEIQEVLPTTLPTACIQLLHCTKCNKKGSLVLCDTLGCTSRYHWSCVGLKVDDPDVKQGFYCAKCKPDFLKKLAQKRQQRERREQEKATRKRLREELAAKERAADDAAADDDDAAAADDDAAAAAAASASGGGQSVVPSAARDAGASGAAAAASTSSSSDGDAPVTKAKSSKASVKNAQVGLSHQLLQLF